MVSVPEGDIRLAFDLDAFGPEGSLPSFGQFLTSGRVLANMLCGLS